MRSKMPERSEPPIGMTREDLAGAVERPAGTWEVVRRPLPPDLAGKSVLDAGCGAGFYSVQAKRLGAARVLGVDARQHEIRQALLVRRGPGPGLQPRPAAGLQPPPG